METGARTSAAFLAPVAARVATNFESKVQVAEEQKDVQVNDVVLVVAPDTPRG